MFAAISRSPRLLLTLLRIRNRDFGSSYQTEMLPQRWKQTAAPGTSSWSAGSEFCSDGSGFVPPKCPCCQFCCLLYRPSRRMFLIDRRLWYHCPVAPDPLPTWVDSWGWGGHITTQSHPYSEHQCGPLSAFQSHGPLFGMSLCLFEF